MIETCIKEESSVEIVRSKFAKMCLQKTFGQQGIGSGLIIAKDNNLIPYDRVVGPNSIQSSKEREESVSD